MLLMSMVPAAQFRNWQWVALVLATPVATWAAAPSTAPHGRTHARPRPRWTHLVSVGVMAAYAWSTYALFFTGSRRRRHEDADVIGADAWRHPPSVLRGGVGDRRPDPRRSVLRSACQASSRWCVTRPAGARRHHRHGRAAHGRTRGAGHRRTARRRSFRGVARRADRHRRCRRGRPVGCRRVAADR